MVQRLEATELDADVVDRQQRGTLAGGGLLPEELGLASLAGVAPAFAGMALGQRVRQGLPDARFRQVVQAALGVLGVWLAVRAFR